jgi:MipA family protein
MNVVGLYAMKSIAKKARPAMPVLGAWMAALCFACNLSPAWAAGSVAQALHGVQATEAVNDASPAARAGDVAAAPAEAEPAQGAAAVERTNRPHTTGRSAPLWELGLGGTALRLAHYRGSDQSQGWLLPLPYFVYRGDIIKADREGARAMLLSGERFQIDLSVAGTAPTKSADNLARAGMPSLKPTLEVGPNLNLYLLNGANWRLLARAPVRAAFTLQGSPRHVGWSASPYLTLELRQGAWDIGWRAGTQWGDRGLHGYVYDVDASYATATRPAYRSRAGFGGFQSTVGASRRIGDSLWVGAFARVDSVNGATFASSPLVRQRSNVSGGLALSWIFARSERMVPTAD